MRGISMIRDQGMKDPLLARIVRERGMEKPPLYAARPPENLAKMAKWAELGKHRHVEPPPDANPTAIDPDEATASLKALGMELGAGDMGVARLTPIMIRAGLDLPHDYILCGLVPENYEVVLDGPIAIESESTSAYVRCAEISTALANHIATLGYSATAHHNGGYDIQALPSMHAAGLGELGKHGSLIHPQFGASFRPILVTTDMPLSPGAPISFGVVDRCMVCNLCSNNCPGDAIPMHDYIITEGVKRWVTDLEKCYEYSRMREQYCHICVDSCPYVHEANRDPDKKALYKQYMIKRKRAGYKTPAWFREQEDEILARADEARAAKHRARTVG